MNNLMIENELATFFQVEVDYVIPRSEWWQRIVSDATSHPQATQECNTTIDPAKPKRGFANWVKNTLDLLRINPQKPILSIATYLLLFVAFVGFSAGVGIYFTNFEFGSSTLPPPTTSSIPNTNITLNALPSASGTSDFLPFIVIGLLALAMLTIILWLKKKRG